MRKVWRAVTACQLSFREGRGGYERTDVRTDLGAVSSRRGLRHTMLLVPRRPTPRANCSRSPEMAPEGLGADDLRPTVEL